MGIYELHVTVEGSTKESFVDSCNAIGVKPILLHLQMIKDGVVGDMMTSSTIKGHSHDAIAESYRIQKELYERGHKVIRRKIETPLSNPIVEMLQDDKLSYFETHLQINCHEKDIESLKFIAKQHQSHLSRNIFKINDDGSQVIMMTIRRKQLNKQEFEKETNSLVETLRWAKFDLGKVEKEFVLYDTNEAHDDIWISHGK